MAFARTFALFILFFKEDLPTFPDEMPKKSCDIFCHPPTCVPICAHSKDWWAERTFTPRPPARTHTHTHSDSALEDVRRSRGQCRDTTQHAGPAAPRWHSRAAAEWGHSHLHIQPNLFCLSVKDMDVSCVQGSSGAGPALGGNPLHFRHDILCGFFVQFALPLRCIWRGAPGSCGWHCVSACTCCDNNALRVPFGHQAGCQQLHTCIKRPEGGFPAVWGQRFPGQLSARSWLLFFCKSRFKDASAWRSCSSHRRTLASTLRI